MSTQNKKELLPYQIEGVRLITTKYNDVLLADHPGAGKTVQAIKASDYLKCEKILVVCPASLRENWRREFKLWSERELSITCVYKPKDLTNEPNVLIISYDLALKYKTLFKDMSFDLLILDEAHYLKNPKSMRTKVCLDTLWGKAKKRICITGTPLPNGRAVEAWSLFSKLSPKHFGSQRQFLSNYCIKNNGFWGVDYNKSKNLKQLGDIARQCFMIRRDRKDTIGQLPPLIRLTIPLKVDHTLDELELLFDFKKNEEEGQFNERIRSARRMHGLLKIKPSIEYLKTLLEESTNCVVFCHHSDVLRGMAKEFDRSNISYTLFAGDTPMSERQKAIDDFQNNKVKVFLGSLLAANTGITLTSSKDVVIVEADWVPSNNEQAEGRCYRLGQKEITRSHYLVIPDSLDDAITASIIGKQKNITEVLRN